MQFIYNMELAKAMQVKVMHPCQTSKYSTYKNVADLANMGHYAFLLFSGFPTGKLFFMDHIVLIRYPQPHPV